MPDLSKTREEMIENLVNQFRFLAYNIEKLVSKEIFKEVIQAAIYELKKHGNQ